MPALPDEIKAIAEKWPQELDHRLWRAAACGRHSNRYCEQDDIWDSTCPYCAVRWSILKELSEAFAESALLAAIPVVARIDADLAAKIKPSEAAKLAILTRWNLAERESRSNRAQGGSCP